jgi:hypothetical protein
MAPIATATPALNSIADILQYQAECVRTGNFHPIGRMQKIAIGPSANWQGSSDPHISRFGRMIDLRDRMLPIAQAPIDKMILVCAPLRDADEKGQPRLPDLPDPAWTPPVLSREEIEGRDEQVIVDGKSVTKRVLVEPDLAKVRAPMMPQRLTDRCEIYDGRPAELTGTNFLIFQPVLRVTFQPELENRLVGTAWTLEFTPDRAGQSCAFLVDHKTGECRFLYGAYDILTPAGE